MQIGHRITVPLPLIRRQDRRPTGNPCGHPSQREIQAVIAAIEDRGVIPKLGSQVLGLGQKITPTQGTIGRPGKGF
jgi:hypothetical protein